MGMNAQLHFVLNSEDLERIRKEAEENNLSISDLCRQKLLDDIPIKRIENLITNFLIELKGGKKSKFILSRTHTLKS